MWFVRERVARRRVCFAVLMGIATALLPHPGQAQEWSRAERRNVSHFVEALNFTLEGIRVSNSGGPGVLSARDRSRILKSWQKALAEGTEVTDVVLRKIHPDLPRHFRGEWQRGLTLQVRNLELGDTQAEIVGSRLGDDWGTWYMRNQAALRLPKRCRTILCL